MSVFAGNCHGYVEANPLLDPYFTISYAEILSEPYLETIFEIFGEYMYPDMMSVSVRYNGEVENINIPEEIVVRNRIVSSTKGWRLCPFPFLLINVKKQNRFYFGNDIMQFVGGQKFYVLSYYRDGITSFSIVLIDNGCIYVVDINSKDDEIRYFELDSATRERMQKYINNQDCSLGICYKNLLDIFKSAKVIRLYKEKTSDAPFKNIVKQLFSNCISSPSQITNILKDGALISESLVTDCNFNLPELNDEAKPNIIRNNSNLAGKIVEYSAGVRRYSERLDDNEEYFVFYYTGVPCEYPDFLWWYAKIEKTKDKGEYRVSYYYYDASTVSALEWLCASHEYQMPILKLKDAIGAGIIPCCITARWFKTLEEAQAEVWAYYNNPESIKAEPGYRKALLRSAKTLLSRET